MHGNQIGRSSHDPVVFDTEDVYGGYHQTVKLRPIDAKRGSKYGKYQTQLTSPKTSSPTNRLRVQVKSASSSPSSSPSTISSNDSDPYPTLDSYMNKDKLPINYGVRRRRVHCCPRLTLWFAARIYRIIHNTYFLLFLLGIIVSAIAFGMDLLAGLAWKGRYNVDDVLSYGLSYVVYVGTCVAGVCMAALLTHRYCPHAAGSGIPELKMIFSGTHIFRHYLSLKTLVVKWIGLALVTSAGLPVGREGPFIHISAIIGKHLLTLGPFRHVDRVRLLSAAAAVGVSTCFGAPVGGVLFSIEVTATVYLVKNIWTGFFCAMCAATVTVFLVAMENRKFSVALFHTNFGDSPFKTSELPVYLLMGVVFGLLGALFVAFHRFVVRWRRRYQSKIFGQGPYLITFIVAMSWAFLAFPLGRFSRLRFHDALNDLFNSKPLDGSTPDSTDDDNGEPLNADDWGDGFGLGCNLTLYSLMNYFFSALCIGLPIPCGLFQPVFAVGAALGRLTGELMHLLADHNILNLNLVTRGGYAVVGAAAMTASVTRTVSCAVIVFELTGELNFLLPILLATLLARGVGNWLTPSIYDSILHLQNVELLPAAPPKWMKYQQKHRAEQIMSRKLPCLTFNPSSKRVEQVLDQFNFETFPLVDSLDNMILLGEVPRDVLEQYAVLKRRSEAYERNAKRAFRDVHSQYLWARKRRQELSFDKETKSRRRLTPPLTVSPTPEAIDRFNSENQQLLSFPNNTNVHSASSRRPIPPNLGPRRSSSPTVLSLNSVVSTSSAPSQNYVPPVLKAFPASSTSVSSTTPIDTLLIVPPSSAVATASHESPLLTHDSEHDHDHEGNESHGDETDVDNGDDNMRSNSDRSDDDAMAKLSFNPTDDDSIRTDNNDDGQNYDNNDVNESDDIEENKEVAPKASIPLTSNIISDYFHKPTPLELLNQQSKHISLRDEPFFSKINQSPFVVPALMSLQRVYWLFWMLRPPCMYVTALSKLVGRLTEKDLTAAARRPGEEVEQVLHSLVDKNRLEDSKRDLRSQTPSQRNSSSSDLLQPLMRTPSGSTQ